MKTCQILGVNIAVTNMEETVKYLEEHIETLRGEYITVCNGHTSVMAYEDGEYRIDFSIDGATLKSMSATHMGTSSPNKSHFREFVPFLSITLSKSYLVFFIVNPAFIKFVHEFIFPSISRISNGYYAIWL